MKSDYGDDNYANIDDIVYILGDIYDNYRPILTSSMFGKGYQGIILEVMKRIVCL